MKDQDQHFEHEPVSSGLHWWHSARLKVFVLVLCWLAIMLGAGIAGLAFLQRPVHRDRLLRLGAGFAGGGAAGMAAFFALAWTGERWVRFRARRRHRRRVRQFSRAAKPPHTAGERFQVRTPRKPSREGAALVFVLLLTGLAAALVLEIQTAARRRLRDTARITARLELECAAADAARAGLQRLADDDDLGADYSAEPWARPETNTGPAGVTTVLVIEDEARRFDLNNLSIAAEPAVRSPRAVAEGLLLRCSGEAGPSFLEAVRDWTDEDEVGDREAAFYRAQGRPWSPPNAAVSGWDEAMRIDGAGTGLLAVAQNSGPWMSGRTSDVFRLFTWVPLARTRPLPVNVNTASRDVLHGILGAGHEAAAGAVIALRELGPLRSLEEVASALGREAFAPVRPWLDVRSRVWRLEVTARRADESERLAVWAERSDRGRVRVLAWAQG